MRKKQKYIKLNPSDLKIGKDVYIYFGIKYMRHTIRARLTINELRKEKISYPKEETKEEYEEYKRIIKKYCHDGNLFELIK